MLRSPSGTRFWKAAGWSKLPEKQIESCRSARIAD